MSRHRIRWDRAAHLPGQFPVDRRAQVAFAGRSNVGKSSLLNRLFAHRLAKVSQTPGKTRSINFYEVDERFYMVDLPGYGYARRSRTERQKFSRLIGQYLEDNASLAGVVHLVDIRHDPMDLDLRVSAYLAELGPPVQTVLTKADKLSRGAGQRQRERIARALEVETRALLPFSCEDGRGVKELWTWVLASARKVDTHAKP